MSTKKKYKVSLQKFQSGSEKGKKKLITYKTDAKLIDGTAAFDLISNVPISPEYNQQIKERLYTGKWGFDPNSGALVKLNKSQQTTIPKETEKILLQQKNSQIKKQQDQEYLNSIKKAGYNPETFAGGYLPNSPEFSQYIKRTTPRTFEELKRSNPDTWTQEEKDIWSREGFSAVMNNPIFQTAAYFTPTGMALGAIQGAANLIPDLYEGDYTSAAIDAAELLPFLGPAVKKTISNIPTYKNVYRVEPTTFSKDMADELSGRWFGDLGDMPFYVKYLKDPDAGIRIIRSKLPTKKWESLSGNNMPESAKVMSSGPGSFKTFKAAADAGEISAGAAKRLSRGVQLPSDLDELVSNPRLINLTEGILPESKVFELRTKNPGRLSSFSRVEFPGGDIGKQGALDYISNIGKDVESPMLGIPRKYFPFSDGGMYGGLFSYQNGGRKPIYTSDPNDPRIQAYRDSTSLYSLGERELKRFFHRYPPRPDGKIRSLKDLDRAFRENSYEPRKNRLYDSHRFDINQKLETFKNLRKIENTFKRTGILPTDFWSSEGFMNYRFKKPVQPVYYKKADASKAKPNIYDYPPIYVSDPNDPRIGMYTEAGNQILYKKPTKSKKSTLKSKSKPVDKVVSIPEPVPVQTENTPPIQMPLRDKMVLPLGRSYSNESSTKSLEGGKTTYGQFEKIIDPVSGKVTYLPTGKKNEFITLQNPNFEYGGLFSYQNGGDAWKALSKDARVFVSPYNQDYNSMLSARTLHYGLNPDTYGYGIGYEKRVKLGDDPKFKTKIGANVSIPYSGEKTPTVQGTFQGDYYTGPNPGSAGAPIMSTKVGAGYDPNKKVNIYVEAMPKWQFGNVPATKKVQDKYYKGDWTAYVGPIGGLGAQIEKGVFTPSLFYGAGAGIEAQPFKAPLRVGADARVGFEAAEGKGYDSNIQRENSGRVAVHNARVYASYPLDKLGRDVKAKVPKINWPDVESVEVTGPRPYFNKPEFDSRPKQGATPVGNQPGYYPNTTAFTTGEESQNYQRYINRPFLPTPTGEMTPTSQFETVQNPTFKRGGEIIKDQEGQRKYPGKVTEIQGNLMATDGYGDIPLYVVPDVGEPRVVMPNTGTHEFKGATKFVEYPLINKKIPKKLSSKDFTSIKMKVEAEVEDHLNWIRENGYEEDKEEIDAMKKQLWKKYMPINTKL